MAANKQDVKEFNKIIKIADPWISETEEPREPWIVTFPSGHSLTLWMPVGAAVAVELACRVQIEYNPTERAVTTAEIRFMRGAR